MNLNRRSFEGAWVLIYLRGRIGHYYHALGRRCSVLSRQRVAIQMSATASAGPGTH